MRNALIALLIAAVALLGYYVYSLQRTTTAHEKQIRDLSAKARGLELQEKCAQQAEAFFRKSEWAKERTAWQENHYNVEMDKCFVVVANAEESNSPTAVTRYLYDAFEGRELGKFVGTLLGDVGGYCVVTQPNGKEAACRSFDEFRALTRIYLQ